MKHIHIDGSQGEGGGQILRSSLALSLVTGKPFTIEKIRANRSKPGLMRQHLTAVLAAAEVGQCKVDHVHVGSDRLDFCPAKVRGGDYVFDIGTAGSTTLVLQTVLPVLMLADDPSTLTLRGGTHNTMAPPFDFIEKVYLPLIERLGPTIKTTFVKHGFYPAGGGEFRVEITPTKRLASLELMERGAILEQKGIILHARLPEYIAEKEKQLLIQKTNLSEDSIGIETITNSDSSGNIVMLKIVSENVTELFVGFGERGVSSNTVVQRTFDQYHNYLVADVPVGEHLADQLMLPLAIATWQGSGASSFRTQYLSQHSLSQIDILQRFLDIEIKAENVNERQVDVYLR